MKKFFFSLFSTLLILGMTSCEGGDGKASSNSVLKTLPGTWKVTQVVDENGTTSNYEGDMVLTFGKQESEYDFNNNHNSSLWGYFGYSKNGSVVVSKGTWNIEPDDEEKGVFFYCMKESQTISILGSQYHMITKINGSTMKLEDLRDISGYILTRVQ